MKFLEEFRARVFNSSGCEIFSARGEKKNVLATLIRECFDTIEDGDKIVFDLCETEIE